MANAAGFAADLLKFTKQHDIDLDLALTKISLELFSRVALKTPVDTGRARASWNISVGEIDTSVQDEGHYGEKDYIEEMASAPRITVEKKTYITNSLPYISALEHGYSQQAPAGMVAITVSEVDAWLQQVVSA